MFVPVLTRLRGSAGGRSNGKSAFRAAFGHGRDRAVEQAQAGRLSAGDQSHSPDIGPSVAAWDFSKIAVHPAGSEPPPPATALRLPGLIQAKLRMMTPSPAASVRRFAGNRQTGRLVGTGAQPKLRIGSPDDVYEREADRIANAMLSAPTPNVQRCAACATRDEDKVVHRTPSGSGSATAAADAAVNDFGPSRGLDSNLRAYFEPRLGQRLDSVRVHTGSRAASAADAVAARAFTLRNHVVFGAGEYAPHTHHGRRLLAHELVHVIQQQSAGEPLVQREMVFASGYARPFKSDWAEVACVLSSRCTWYPASIDFHATANHSGGGSGSATFEALLSHIEAAAPRSITELGIIGHANSSNFGLAGKIDAKDVWFSKEGLIDAASLEHEKGRIAKLRDRFAPGAKIILYGCHAGVGTTFLDAISRAFHVCVKGFSNEITWCIRWHTPGRHIFSRGRTWVDTGGLEQPQDIGCAKFNADIRALKPDRESCVGVPVPKPAPKAPVHSPAAPRFGAGLSLGGALSGEGWRAAIDLGLRYSLRRDRVIVIDPTVGAHLLYLPSGGDRLSHIATAIAEFGVRVQQPLHGLYVDVHAGVYAGVQIPTGAAPQGVTPIGGVTGALGAGYRWERLSLGAQARGLAGAGPSQVVIVGVGTLNW